MEVEHSETIECINRMKRWKYQRILVLVWIPWVVKILTVTKNTENRGILEDLEKKIDLKSTWMSYLTMIAMTILLTSRKKHHKKRRKNSLQKRDKKRARQKKS